ncbi:hypothetical protein RM446_03035 [Streptomonospora sp. DSM 45055]|uniref:Uncharacterized protein n=1 Tax=Streptomonospora wellingtoniae TaxID=3075544 RepID=A0ABU2KP90_9ACTN|nr:hypothetical protein [Streptomonospora sp. DSM 45055]MDT0301082.1 hypothetical protein [Streptomonospora sp. DSM 45055]
MAQALLRYNDERRWLRRAPERIGHLFPRLIDQAEYHRRLRTLAPQMFAAAMWLARAIPTRHEQLRLVDGTPVPCGASRTQM